jgi:xylan 1,4-beta-xylosidase
MQRRIFFKQTVYASAAALLPYVPSGRSLPGDPVELAVSAAAAGTRLEHFWSECVGAGRANEGLRASWQEQLKLASEACGFGYCRFHGLFHDDMFVYKEESGHPVYNWQYVDDLFDRMLDMNVRPFVELGFMPEALAADPSVTQFWWKGHVSPPKDFEKWGALIRSFVGHCVARYGLDEVRLWYFEVWNEPNLNGFWSGTRSQYFELYKVSVEAIKSVDTALRVGGPATSNFVPDDRFAGEKEDKSKQRTHSVPDLNTLAWHGVWIEEFLQYCHGQGLPVDFISCHPYPTDWALDPATGKGSAGVRRVSATRDDLLWLRQVIRSSPYPDAEIQLTEWSSSPSPRDPSHDSLPAATFIIRANLECIGLSKSLSYWTFTDIFEEKGAGDTMWHGGFGLINYQGIVKPSFHAYRMLHALGDEMLERKEGIVVTRHRRDGKLTALLYHYPAEVKDAVKGPVEGLLNTGLPRKFSLTIEKMKARQSVTIETLDRDHGYGYGAWKAMGAPEPCTREEGRLLRSLARRTRVEIADTGDDDSFRFSRVLNPWDCLLIHIG